MELIFTIENLKSAITFMHLVGLAFGVGGAWILDWFIVNHLKKEISLEKYNIIEFVSTFVIIGLAVLWVSGLFFLAYYYKFTPEFLGNQKVWGKVVIVTILTVNGLLVHKMVLPKLKAAIGGTILASLTKKEVKVMTVIGTTSFLSWLFPVVLGVSKSLNFTVSAFDIVGFYMVTLAISIAIAFIISNQYLLKGETFKTQEA